MKSIISLLVVLGLTFTTYAQEAVNDSNAKETSKDIKLPAVVIKKVGEDFSIYLPEIENFDSKINYIQNSFIAYDLGKDYEGFDTYLVTLAIKDASLVAAYDENGKLISVVEKYKNVRLPNKVVHNILKQYPDWKIVNDKYSYSQEGGNVKKKQYVVLLEKENKTKKVTFDPEGEVIK